MSRNIIFIATAIGLYWGLKWCYGKRDGTASDMPNKVFSLLAFLFAIGFIFGTPYFGTKIPGSFFERDEYEGVFYVNLFPDGQKVLSYRIPAMISAIVESVTGQDNETYSWQEYRIEFAIIPDEGRVTFDNDSSEHLKLGKIVEVRDDNKRDWGVELTDQPVRQ
jgi:hypothetical protein